MQFFGGLIVGFILGAGFGLLVYALISFSGDDEPSKPAKLLMPGQSVIFDGEVWEIKRLDIAADGQTVAVLWNGSEELSVPVEEVGESEKRN